METKVQTDEFITETARQISDYLSTARSEDARPRYKIGVLVLEVESTSHEGKYGKGTVFKIAKLVGITAAALYQYAEVAKMWAPDRFEELVQRRNEKGVGLSFSMFVELAHKDHAEHRDERLEKALAENLSVRTVRTLRETATQERGRAKKLVNAKLALATASQVPEKNLPDEAAQEDLVLMFDSEPACPSLISNMEEKVTELRDQKRALDRQIERLHELMEKKRMELVSTETNSAPAAIRPGLNGRLVQPERHEMSAAAV